MGLPLTSREPERTYMHVEEKAQVSVAAVFSCVKMPTKELEKSSAGKAHSQHLLIGQDVRNLDRLSKEMITK